MKSIFVAALLATGAYGLVCPSNIPAITASITQSYQGSTSPYMWTISPTAKSDLTPTGTSNACVSAYIAQYSGGSCDAACDQQKIPPYITNNACVYTFTDGGSRIMTVTLSCNEGSTTLQMDPTVPVTDQMSGLVYSFKGSYSGVCGSDPGPGPGPGPGPAPGPNGDDEKKDPACGGGCAFVIIFFVGAFLYVACTVAFNYFKLGKRGKELAPHPEFWLLIPGLIKDGGIFTFRLITTPCRKDSGATSTYSQV